MGDTLIKDQVQKANYWYEKLPYTLQTTNLGTSAQVFSLSNVSAIDSNKEVIVSDLAVTNTSAGLYLDLQQNSQNRQVNTLAFPASLAPIMTGREDGLRSTGKISTLLVNNSGAVIAGPLQFNYSAAVKQMSVAEKIMRGLPLSQQEQALQQKYQLGNRGLFPISIDTALDKAFLSRVVSSFEYADLVNFSTSLQSISNESPQNDHEMLVITSIAAEAAAQSNATITITRDSDENYVQILADNMSINRPFDCWIPAMHSINVQIQATGAVNNVPIRIQYKRIRLSTLILAMFGLLHTNSASPKDQELYNQVRAGVVV